MSFEISILVGGFVLSFLVFGCLQVVGFRFVGILRVLLGGFVFVFP